MIVVTAADPGAVATLAAVCGPERVAALTVADLAGPGWAWRLGAGGEGRLRCGGRVVDAAEVEGVVTALPWVDGAELVGIPAGRRAVVAAELRALLVGWLAGLRVPVLDRPTPGHLCGCGRTAAAWALLARRLGVGWAGGDAGGVWRRVTVVEGAAVDAWSSAAAEVAMAVAGGAGRRLLSLRLSVEDQPRLLGVERAPFLGSAAVAAAVCAALERGV